MFLSEWREFPSASCLAGKKKRDDISRLDVVEIARVPDMLQSCLLPGRAKDLSAPRYLVCSSYYKFRCSLYPHQRRNYIPFAYNHLLY